MRQLVLLAALLLAGCFPALTSTPTPGAVTPSPVLATATPTETPWFLTPTPEDWTITPTPAPIRYGTVTATRLNLRSGPSVETAIIGILDFGEIVFVIKTSADSLWYELERGGWVSAAYVRMETL